MSITMIQTPALAPAFGMSAIAPTSPQCARTWDVEAVVAHVALVTDRVKGAYITGDNAWSPPIT